MGFMNKSRFLIEMRVRLTLLHGLVSALPGLWGNLCHPLLKNYKCVGGDRGHHYGGSLLTGRGSCFQCAFALHCYMDQDMYSLDSGVIYMAVSHLLNGVGGM